MSHALPSEDYGRRLLPTVIDSRARAAPDRILYSFPVTNDPADGFHDVSAQHFANAVNRTAWWIEESYGKASPGSFPSIGYIGPNDLRYGLLVMGAIKASYKMVLLSPRNSIEGHRAVLEGCDCQLWALPSQRLGRVDQILLKRPMRTADVPELLDLLHTDPVPEYLYTKTFAEARSEPFAVLHTSGSTGLPKPIVCTHGNYAPQDAHRLMPLIGGRATQTAIFETPHRAYSTFPYFHAAGLNFLLGIAHFYELSIVCGPASVPVNVDLVNAMLDHGNVEGTMLAPFTLEQISRNLSSMQRLAKTSYTIYAGGPLNKASGDTVNTITRVYNFIGTTEGSLFPMVQTDKEDWNYFHYHPSAGFTYRQQTDELWEQFQTRDPKLELFQAYFHTFPDQDEVSILDLYSKHPTKQDLWQHRGRTDDVIVLSNGEKVNPLDMEASINAHPAVKACLVVGQGRFQTAALIELHDPLPEEPESLKESLWTSFEAANRDAPAHGQLHKDHIIFTTPDKPFLLAGKGTVIRAMTVRLYESEINDYYNAQERLQEPGICFNAHDLVSIRAGIRTSLEQCLGAGVHLGLKEDLFAAGIDSLSVLKVLTVIRASIGNKPITASLVYSNPTIAKLSDAVEQLVRPSATHEDVSELRQMAQLLEKYTGNLPAKACERPICVLLTGSTGSLGSYLLDELISNPSIAKVFCLNRSADAREIQLKSNDNKGIHVKFCPDRVKFLQADLTGPKLGLDECSYDELQRETTHIIHNQWKVDFNQSLHSFEPLIQGVRNLVDFALESTANPEIIFVSSIGVVSGQTSTTPVAEEIITDLSAAQGGYGKSKLLSELILSEASVKRGLRCRICRVGQISGPVNTPQGSWNKHEWLPSIIAGSKRLGMIPSDLACMDRIDWLPVDRASRIICELAGLSSEQKPVPSSSQLQVFHVVNPCARPWSSLIPAVTECFGPSVPVVPWSTWLAALEASERALGWEQIPALKLLDFYRAMDKRPELPALETTRTRTKSRTLRALGPVEPRWMSLWLQQWNF